MTALRVSKRKAYDVGCERCGYKTTMFSVPKRCPSCKSPYWNVKAGTLPKGRPKAKKPPPRGVEAMTTKWTCPYCKRSKFQRAFEPHRCSGGAEMTKALKAQCYDADCPSCAMGETGHPDHSAVPRVVEKVKRAVQSGGREIPAYVGSARAFKARKRRELAALEQALNTLRNGCAFTPFYLDFDNVAARVQEWRRVASAKEWGR